MNVVDGVGKDEVNDVHRLLGRKYGTIYADIWKLGVNVSLRISDLLAVKFADLDVGNRTLTLIEGKTGKNKCVRLNEPALEIIQRRRLENPDHVWLFQVSCNRAKNQPISRVSVSRAFKSAGDVLGVTINTHSMRKSRGKAMFEAGVSIEKICKVLNHSDTGVTLRYLGITQAEILKTYDDFIL